MSESDPAEDGYLAIVAHYEDCLAKHGDSHLGVDWPNREDALNRYRVMLGLLGPVAPDQQVSLLDFGCGASHLYEYMVEHRLTGIEYSGLDLSEQFIALSREKFPQNAYYCVDALAESATLPTVDYVVMAGWNSMPSMWDLICPRRCCCRDAP